MPEQTGLEKAGTIAFRVYCVVCLLGTATVFFDQEYIYRQVGLIWQWAASISDPVFRVIVCGIVILAGLAFVPGWFGGLLAWTALLLGVTLLVYTYKGVTWLASISLGGAVVVTVIIGAGVVLFIHKFWDPIVEGIARVVLVVMSFFGLGGREKHLFTRLGAGGMLCGLVLFAIGMWHRVPTLLEDLYKKLAIKREYIVLAPVGQWSDSIHIARLQSKLNQRFEGAVIVQDDEGRCLNAGPWGFEDRTYSRWPQTVRFKSRLRSPVKVHFFSTAPITAFPEPNRSPDCNPVQRPPVRTLRQRPVDNAVYHVGGDVSAPVVTSKQEPTYSDQAREANVQGTVVVHFEVDKEGRVRNAQIVKPLGYGLDEKALEAIAHWKFKPALKSGMPVAVRATAELNFRRF